MWNPFKIKLMLSAKAKILIAVFTLVLMAGGGVLAYRFYDFTQNNPRFCVTCHLMKEAFDAWAVSEHKSINCHDCHHLSIPEQNQLLISFVFKRPAKVPERHGKVIVTWKYCTQCHWERSAKYPDAPLVSRSRIHAKHYFMEQIECVACHGYITHKFTPEERFCLKCHEDKEVHGTGMEALACLNCHTDRTVDLKPGRSKCLFCHGSKEVREELIADATLDVRYFQPREDVIRKATKIDVPADAPMQFYCYECHKPHTKVRPDWGNCLTCHKGIKAVGKHSLHIEQMGMKCAECHKPHGWRVTAKTAKKDCIRCHEYKDPKTFI